ncbi:MAG: nucleotidyl transferase AbiEii/AbiGii toxin family protein [Chloroflexi bacterium]|nr:nucleotidyl transferase AbiEii/AbiGii toxin family protein [Chloroflexota bacterium]
MIPRVALNERVREWGLREDVVEKDYVIGWVLWGIGADPRLSASWAFKGGTCLKKCYLETYRFSEDLDFTVLPDGPIRPDEVVPLLQGVLKRVYDQAGIDFAVREPTVRLRPNEASAEGRIYYRGPRNTPQPASLKLDLSVAEKVVRPTVLRPISHEYPDQLPSPASVQCYGFEELFAEKLRAMGERSRPRDLYDIVNLFRRRAFLPHAGLIRSVYVEKCRSKGVPVFTLAALEASPYRAELETEWANMLGHQLPALPPFEQFWQELPYLFSWLDGAPLPEALSSLAAGDTEDVQWSPPPTVWVWGQGVPLEPVRFAGVNHLCVELGYQRSTRLIQPYSLRRTKEGALLLYAVTADTGELRSYRVDRIESIKVTNTPFTPRYAIEFGATGPV